MAKELTPLQRAEAAEAELANLKPAHQNAQSALITANETIAALTGERDAAKADLAKEIALHGDAKVRLAGVEAELKQSKAAHELLTANFESELVKRASLEAAKIVAAQGVPPVATKTNDKPADTGLKDEPKKGDYLASLAAGFKADLAKKV